MHHLVGPIFNKPMPEAIVLLAEAHDYLVAWATEATADLKAAPPHRWGIQAKRSTVEFPGKRPTLIQKASERFGEVMNIAATLERLIDALSWFEQQPAFSRLIVLECHPSTSHTSDANDLVLSDKSGIVRVRCEVSDVLARTAHQNNKEKLDLTALGITGTVPNDGARRFLAVSSEFAHALANPRRAWQRLPYRYSWIPAHSDHLTTLLEVISADLPPA